MATALLAALISAVQFALLLFCGLGLSLLLVPARLRQQTLLLAPLFGLALIALLGFYGTNAGFNLRQILPVLLLLATTLLGVAIWHDRRWPMLPEVGELVPLTLLLVCTWLLNIAPTLRYGALMPIGHNWDIEFYLALADYLKDYSYQTLAQVPANPLRSTVLANPTFVRAMGATYAQATADLLGGWPAWISWVPMLALLRSIGLLGLYALLRSGLGMRPAAASVGVALVGMHSLLLWTTYNSFGMGIGGMALLPAALLIMLVALEDGGWQALVGAGFLLGGLACVYWPMLMAYGAGGLGLGLALLYQRWRTQAVAIIWRAVLILVGGGLLSLMTHVRAQDAFLDVFVHGQTDIPASYISPAVILGTLPFPVDGIFSGGAPANSIFEVIGWVSFGSALLLLMRAIGQPNARRPLLLGMLLSSIMYLVGLRFVIRFPYGYLRGASYINTLIVGLIGAGLHAPVATTPTRHRLRRSIGALLMLLVLFGSGLAGWRAYAVYADQPGMLAIQANTIRKTAEHLPVPGPVAFTPRAATTLCGPALLPWAYGLRSRPLFGHVEAAYGTLSNPSESRAPAYIMLGRNEDPRAEGLVADPIWSDADVRLYLNRSDQVAWLNGRSDRDASPPLCEKDVTNLARDQLDLSDYDQATPKTPLALSVGSTLLSRTTLPHEPPAQRQVELVLLSFQPQTIALHLGVDQRTITIPAGVSVYRTGLLATPLTITLQPSQAIVALQSAALVLPSTPSPPLLVPRNDVLLLGIASHERPAGARVDVQVANPSQEALRMSVEIYQEVAGYSSAAHHYAASTFVLPPDGQNQIDLQLTPLVLRLNDTPLPFDISTPRDGHYYAALWVYQGEHVRARIPIFQFFQQQGQVRQIISANHNAVMIALGRPAQALRVQAGTWIELRAIDQGNQTARRGEQRKIGLFWHALARVPHPYQVSVQVLDASKHKIAQWDGPVGGTWLPASAWQPGQQIWQDLPLTIPADAPPGTYRLLLILYDPVSNQRLELSSGGILLQIGMLEVVP